MSLLSQFGGGSKATTSIVNAYSAGGVKSGNIVAANVDTNAATAVLMASLTANILAAGVTVTGAGELSFLTATATDTTSRTIRLKVTVDGVVVFDATSSAIITAGQGIVVVGQGASASYFITSGSPIKFNTSLLVEVASSLTGANQVNVNYSLNKT